MTAVVGFEHAVFFSDERATLTGVGRLWLTLSWCGRPPQPS
ncbi:hypothetical protein [Kitasatospora kifunensis]|uniref:Uncharacterized protein n=1 Tax=Kitasatospora kifunensis TaxID=58351 RepID=A0A7W7VW25_KITKI|nr:hypothetical protein [Kitasatospora kifunensis]MBB4924105.1 hypothetical protein [Kitasatospora kifunensis]